MDKMERQIVLYSSAVTAILLNSGRLMAIRNNTVMSHFWEFSLPEYIFQLFAQFVFCYLVFWLNLKSGLLARLREQKYYTSYIFSNLLVSFCYLLVAGILQRFIFQNELIRGLYWATYLGRIGLSLVLIGILIKVILLMRDSKRHIIENEQLKSAYATAELELLKEQLNPHFLFNSLSTLSGVIRENPVLAQQYVKHLSRVFRYSLSKSTDKLVSLSDELAMLSSFGELLRMRMEGAFKLTMDVPVSLMSRKLPHLSLQPLLENAAKHNIATEASPLLVRIYMDADSLVISNNLQPMPAESNGIGLANLNERFRILMNQELAIIKTTNAFTVKIPLQHG